MCLLVDLANRGIAGHSAGRTRDAGLVLAAFATLDFPLTDVQVFHTDRGSEFDNTRIDGLSTCSTSKIAVTQGQTLRQRRGRIDEQAAEEGARVPEPLHHDRAAEARPRRLRVVVRQPAAPFHPRIPESEGIHRTGTRPLRNCPTHRYQSSRGRATASTTARRSRPSDISRTSSSGSGPGPTSTRSNGIWMGTSSTGTRGEDRSL